MVSGLTCSSTKVREFALEGRASGAAMLLGRPLEVTGEVVHGAGRGRTIGIPHGQRETRGRAASSSRHLRRARSTAARRERRSGGRRPRLRAEHRHQPDVHRQRRFYRSRPTCWTSTATSTARRLRLEIVHRLRDEQRFESTEALVEQIHADFAETRRVMAG